MSFFKYSIFFTCLWSVCTAMIFKYKGRLLTRQQKCHFCRLVLYLYACAVENPEILGFCVSEIRVVHIYHNTSCSVVTQTKNERPRFVENNNIYFEWILKIKHIQVNVLSSIDSRCVVRKAFEIEKGMKCRYHVEGRSTVFL